MTNQPPARGRITPETLYDLTFVSDAQISPNGAQVAYVRTTIDRQASAYRSRLWLAPTGGGEATPFTSGPDRDSYPRWSPDGRWLAFLSRRNDKNQIWLMPTDGGEAMALTATKNGVVEFAWSPDSRQIAFVTRTGPVDAEAAPTGPSVEPVSDEKVITGLRHKADGEGFFDGRRKHVWLLALDADAFNRGVAPTARQLTDGDADDYSPAWSPDSQSLAFVSDRTVTDPMQLHTDLFVVSTAPSEGTPAARQVTRSAGPVNAPAWSPDGRSIAFVGHDTPERYRRTAYARLWVVDADGGADPRCLTAALDRAINVVAMSDARVNGPEQTPIWAPDGSAIYVQVGDRGLAHAYRIDHASGAAQAVTSGDRNLLNFTLDVSGGRLVGVVTDHGNPGDVYAWSVGAGGAVDESRLTAVNQAVFAQLEVAAARPFAVRMADGADIAGWLMAPVGAKPGQPFPAVLQIHGGPHAQYGVAFFLEFQVLAAAGIGVIFTNPRGSHGYGQAFVHANHNDWGGVDMADLMACVDACIGQGAVDGARLGVAGGSFGGFMTNWIIGQTTRFKAAMSDRSISNFVSKWGVSDIGWCGNDWEWGGPPYDDFDRYMRASPIYYVKKIVTPLLMIHGEDDLRCPVAEAEQFFSALKRLGQEVTLIRFPGESHDFSRSGKPVRRVKRLNYIRDWFTRWLT